MLPVQLVFPGPALLLTLHVCFLQTISPMPTWFTTGKHRIWWWEWWVWLPRQPLSLTHSDHSNTVTRVIVVHVNTCLGFVSVWIDVCSCTFMFCGSFHRLSLPGIVVILNFTIFFIILKALKLLAVYNIPTEYDGIFAFIMHTYVMYKLRFCTSCNLYNSSVQVATCMASLYKLQLVQLNYIPRRKSGIYWI